MPTKLEIINIVANIGRYQKQADMASVQSITQAAKLARAAGKAAMLELLGENEYNAMATKHANEKARVLAINPKLDIPDFPEK